MLLVQGTYFVNHWSNPSKQITPPTFWLCTWQRVETNKEKTLLQVLAHFANLHPFWTLRFKHYSCLYHRFAVVCMCPPLLAFAWIGWNPSNLLESFSCTHSCLSIIFFFCFLFLPWVMTRDAEFYFSVPSPTLGSATFLFLASGSLLYFDFIFNLKECYS